MFRWTLRAVVVLVTVIGMSMVTSVYADVLVRVTPVDSDVLDQLREWPLAVHYYGESFLIAGVRGENLPQLEKSGIDYEVIDDEAWSQPYYIVNNRKGDSLGAIPGNGRVIWKTDKTALVKIADDQTMDLLKAGLQIMRLFPRPLPVAEERPQATKRVQVTQQASDVIGALLNQVSQETIIQYVQRLQDFRTRFFATDSCDAAARWLVKTFREFGYTDVIEDTCIAHPYGVTLQNVIATKPGTVHPDSVIVIGGHFDSIVFDGNDAFVWAPGANDNASGVVAVMEAARILADIDLDCTVKFACWDAEEIGLFGAWDYAGKAFNRNEKIKLYINYDMIAFLSEELPVRDINVNYNPLGESYADVMVEMANTYTSLVPVKRETYPSGSDHAPFMEYGYGIVYAEESDFPWDFTWHAGSDVIENMDISYMTEVVKIGTGVLLVAAGPPASYSAPSVGYQALQADDDKEGESLGNGNGFFDPGETIELTLSLQNYGGSQALNVMGTVATEDPHATILSGSQSFGNIPSDGHGQNMQPFMFRIAEDCPNGHYIDFTVEAVAGGNTWTSYFTIRVEQPSMFYLTFGLDEVTGNSDGNVGPGETGTLHVLLANVGLRRTSGINAVLETEDADVTITVGEVDFPDIEIQNIAQNMDRPFTLSLSEQATPHAVDFSLRIYEEAGYFENTLSLRWMVGQGTVLLVADDQDAGYEWYYIETLQNMGVPYGIADIEGVPMPFSADPLDYSEVIWFTAATDENTLTPDDQTALMTFLDGGGRLLISGNMLGYDIGNTEFYRQYLHGKFVSFLTMLHNLNSAVPNPVVEEMDIALSSRRPNAQNFAAETDPVSPAVSIFNYDRTTAEGPGIIKSSGSGALAVENSVYKLAYFSFGLEGIESTEERAQIITDVLEWFKEPGIDKGDVDGNGTTNIIDAIVAVNFVLGTDTPSADELARTDMNYDGVINILDVIQVVNAVLGS